MSEINENTESPNSRLSSSTEAEDRKNAMGISEHLENKITEVKGSLDGLRARCKDQKNHGRSGRMQEATSTNTSKKMGGENGQSLRELWVHIMTSMSLESQKRKKLTRLKKQPKEQS